MKTALLLCASHNDLGLIRSLRKLGYYILVIGRIPGLIGEKSADEYIELDYSDKEQVLELAKERKIDAIVQCCNDFGVYTAAYVAERLGLPGYDSYETTLTLHNKDEFKKLAEELCLLSPEAHWFSEKAAAEEYLRTADYPVIIKPVDASAGNGIQKASNLSEAEHALDYAFSNSREKRIVIEQYIEGSQHGFCTFLINQKVVAVSSNNEYSFLNPYRVEIDTFPADHYDMVKNILVGQIEKIADSLKLTDGIFHLQYIFDGEKPQIIEVMRRILGNMYSVPANELCGFDWDYWETRARCGLSLENFPVRNYQEGYYAYKTILAESDGRIEEIHIPSEYEKYLYESCMIKKAGDVIGNHVSEPVGFLFLQFSSYGEMKKVLIDEYANKFVKVSCQ